MRGQNKILHEHKGEGEDQDDGPEELNVSGCFWNKKKTSGWVFNKSQWSGAYLYILSIVFDLDVDIDIDREPFVP